MTPLPHEALLATLAVPWTLVRGTNRLLAIGTIVLLTALASGAVLWLARRSGSTTAGGLVDRGACAVRPHALAGATGITTLGLVGSLYLSEVAGYVPCTLCWVQRALIYPAAALLLVAGRRRWARHTAGALLALDLPASSFHVLGERIPSLLGDTCASGVPCSLRWMDEFGFVTIPTMAATVALTGLVLLVLASRQEPT
jgi:hypothetical protein